MPWIENDTLTALGQHIRAIREKKDLSQEECADNVGVSKASWSNWENGRQAMPLLKLPDVARTLGVTIAQLLKPMEGK